MRLVLLVSVCALLWSLESVWPLQQYRKARLQRAIPSIALTALVILMNLALSLVVATVCPERGLSVPMAVVGIAALDLSAHKVHHSRAQQQTDSNYSDIFSLWDRLFGTYTRSADLAALRYGLDGFDAPSAQTLRGLLRIPFMSLLLLMFACTTTPAPKRTILFMCPYGGAKSVIATSYFNRIAERDALPFVAVAVAAETPYDAVPDNVATLLAREGVGVSSFKPRRVTASDFTSAARVISIDCDLTKVDARGVAIEHWDDVPKVSVDLPRSAEAIRSHVEMLVCQLR